MSIYMESNNIETYHFTPETILEETLNAKEKINGIVGAIKIKYVWEWKNSDIVITSYMSNTSYFIYLSFGKK